MGFMTGQKIYDNFIDGTGPEGLSGSAAMVRQLAEEYHGEGSAIRQLTAKMESVWQGGAAGAAQRGAGSLATEHELAAPHMGTAQDLNGRQAGSFMDARNAVKPVPPPPGAPDPWAAVNSLGEVTTYRQKVAEFNAANQHNVDVMTGYTAASRSTPRACRSPTGRSPTIRPRSPSVRPHRRRTADRRAGPDRTTHPASATAALLNHSVAGPPGWLPHRRRVVRRRRPARHHGMAVARHRGRRHRVRFLRRQVGRFNRAPVRVSGPAHPPAGWRRARDSLPSTADRMTVRVVAGPPTGGACVGAAVALRCGVLGAEVSAANRAGSVVRAWAVTPMAGRAEAAVACVVCRWVAVDAVGMGTIWSGTHRSSCGRTTPRRCSVPTR
jgi:hypothetical protein